jgi:hypothetical protein
MTAVGGEADLKGHHCPSRALRMAGLSGFLTFSQCCGVLDATRNEWGKLELHTCSSLRAGPGLTPVPPNPRGRDLLFPINSFSAGHQWICRALCRRLRSGSGTLAQHVEFLSEGFAAQQNASLPHPLYEPQFKFDALPTFKSAGVRQLSRPAANIFFAELFRSPSRPCAQHIGAFPYEGPAPKPEAPSRPKLR